MPTLSTIVVTVRQDDWWALRRQSLMLFSGPGLIKVIPKSIHLSPIAKLAPHPMRLRCFLLALIFTFAACSYGLTHADDVALIKNPELDSSRVVVSDDNVKRHLKGSKTIELEGEERAFLGLTSLQTLSNKFPHLDKLKTLIKENSAVRNAKLLVSKHLPLQGVVAIVKGEFKPMVIIAAVALTGGYIVYLVKD